MPTAATVILILAVMLSVAILGGYLAKWLRIPRIIGYIAAGIALKQTTGIFHNLEPDPTWFTPLTNLVTDMALGLILFTIGQVFERKRIRATKGTLGRVSLGEMVLTGWLTAVGCAIAAWTEGGSALSIAAPGAVADAPVSPGTTVGNKPPLILLAREAASVLARLVCLSLSRAVSVPASAPTPALAVGDSISFFRSIWLSAFVLT